MIRNTTAEGTFINLVRSVLNNEKPAPLPEGVTAEELYELGCRQHMATMILCGLNMIEPRPASENWGRYITLLSAGCMNSEIQMQEYRRLVEYLCANGVRIIPLKGCVINELYPSAGLRTMCDVDLLYSGVDTKKLAALMEAFGYTTDSLYSTCHDRFHKENELSVELHRKLIADYSPYRPVLENMFEKAVADEEIPNLYHMKPEDLYVHVIAHAAKHFEKSGMGLRPLADIYLLNQRYKDSWDKEYIDRQLGRVHLRKFEAKLNGLACAFFGDEESEVSEEDIQFIFRAGLYGVHHDDSWTFMRKGGKSQLAFFLYKIFYPYPVMCEIYPFLKKWPVLLPAMWLYRIADVLINRRENLGKIAKMKVNDEAADYIARVHSSFGLGDCAQWKS